MNAAPMPAGRLLPPLYVPSLARAPYACQPHSSRGRLYPEPESATRTCYQRDRDRIIHSAAFRRLKHKTQVFVQHEGDYYRTRLTHSLEVAQIARSVARLLAVDEDLAEGISLAHDLGHTPFGHSGEEALNAAASAIGGFDHNAHALRLVTRLEHRYATFDGLNLTWESLEGLVKHNGPLVNSAAPALLPAPISAFDTRWSLELGIWPSLEAQIAALADDIAYVNHDIDDALRANLFSVDDLVSAPLAGIFAEEICKSFGVLELGRFIGEFVRRLVSRLIADLMEETCRRMAVAAPSSPAEIRNLGRPVAAFSDGMTQDLAKLKDFLLARMYRHPRVTDSMSAARRVVTELYSALTGDPRLLPSEWRADCGAPHDPQTGRIVRDYIAGMTDRFALLEHRRIFGGEIVL